MREALASLLDKSCNVCQITHIREGKSSDRPLNVYLKRSSPPTRYFDYVTCCELKYEKPDNGNLYAIFRGGRLLQHKKWDIK